MPASAEDIASTLGPLIGDLAREFGRTLPPDVIEGFVNDHLNGVMPPPETGAVGAGQFSRDYLVPVIVGIVVTAFAPEIAAGRVALQDKLSDFGDQVEQMIELGKEEFDGRFEPHEVEAIISRATARFRSGKPR